MEDQVRPWQLCFDKTVIKCYKMEGYKMLNVSLGEAPRILLHACEGGGGGWVGGGL